MGKMARARIMRAASEGVPLRALLYARASADKEKSVDDQADECLEFCEDEGFDVVQVLRENKRSASRYATKERPQFKKVLELMRSGTVDVLVTWENSRAQRDLEVYVELRKICEEFGVLWAYGGDVYDMRDPADRKATARDAVNSESESEDISVRVTRGVRRRAKKGLWHGSRQYGYKREHDPDTGKPLRQVIDPVQGPIVREIVDGLLAGHSVNSIVKSLNDRKVPCSRSGEWNASKIRYFAMSPVYLGKRILNGEVIADGQWPALVTPVEHYTLVNLLTNPSRVTHKDGTRAKHLLSGIALCGRCGSTMGVIKADGYPSYGCRRTRHIVRNKARVDAFIEAALFAALESSDAADVFRVSQGEEIADAFAEAKVLRARLDAFYAQAAQGKLSATGLAAVEADLLPQIEKAERKAEQAMLPPALLGLVGPQARQVWGTLEPVQKRAVVRTVMTPRILPVGKGARNYNRLGVEPGFHHQDGQAA
ncbi:recombinase family protein [Kutzneria buriramensis]|uniref:DNA invertase Pin-like site-specific DNA recombinase n=1 Tax=Kutzneria buriramensis TaxID=1045776 RepID=A0A3E0HD13_9PSEU|nr:recombinase family protein [Kutzneria buriramensis]REH42735.1 DNA invertase Pin-like site-specific DNA recombinase [Kutzneria buriramensis]